MADNYSQAFFSFCGVAGFAGVGCGGLVLTVEGFGGVGCGRLTLTGSGGVILGLVCAPLSTLSLLGGEVGRRGLGGLGVSGIVNLFRRIPQASLWRAEVTRKGIATVGHSRARRVDGRLSRVVRELSAP